MKKYILRPFYLDKVKPYISKNIIKVIIGQRRVGKSYLLYQIIDHIEQYHPDASIIYINKELYEFDAIRDYHDLLREVKKKSCEDKLNYLFIDEIQEIKNFQKALRSLLASGKHDIYCSGSNAELLSGDLATLISGRYVEIKVHPLTYQEFLEFQKQENNKEGLDKFIKFGGMPYLNNLTLEDPIVFDYLKNVYNTIILKDIVSRYHIRNVYFLDNLIKYLADNVGSIFSGKKISDYLKSQKINISPNIVLNYLNYLCASFFLLKAKRTDIKGKKIFEVGKKYYFADLGLRHTIKPFLLTDINKIIENVVYNHLSFCGFDILVGQYTDKEIDFVCTRASEKIYIQVAYAITDDKTAQREFGNLLAIRDNHKKMVVTMDEIRGSSYEGVEHLYLKDFLSNYK